MRHLACALIFVFACGKKDSAAPTGAASASASASVAIDAAAKPPAAPDASAVDAAAPSVPDAEAASDDEGGLYFHLPEAFWTTDCPKVLRRISECSADKAFRANVTAGLKGKDKKEMLRRIDNAADWKDRPDPCDGLRSVAFEDEGFLADDWRDMATPPVLGDCAALGTAVAKHGGLFGGDVDE